MVVLDASDHGGPLRWMIFENSIVSSIFVISTTNVLLYSVIFVLFLYFFYTEGFFSAWLFCWADLVALDPGTAKTFCMNLLHHYACLPLSVGPNRWSTCWNEGSNRPVTVCTDQLHIFVSCYSLSLTCPTVTILLFHFHICLNYLTLPITHLFGRYQSNV